MARLQDLYRDTIAAQLKEQLGLSNVSEVPRITKITLNMGVGEAVADKKLVDKAIEDMELIAGQKAVRTLARKSVAAFKIRDGQPIGCKVTLRRERMYEFLDRLVNVALPRTRDFRGLNARSFDGRGNYSMGIQEQIIFPEISIDKVNKITGMDITFVTNARTDEQSFELLKSFGMPFTQKNNN